MTPVFTRSVNIPYRRDTSTQNTFNLIQPQSSNFLGTRETLRSRFRLTLRYLPGSFINVNINSGSIFNYVLAPCVNSRVSRQRLRVSWMWNLWWIFHLLWAESCEVSEECFSFGPAYFIWWKFYCVSACLFHVNTTQMRSCVVCVLAMIAGASTTMSSSFISCCTRTTQY